MSDRSRLNDKTSGRSVTNFVKNAMLSNEVMRANRSLDPDRTASPEAEPTFCLPRDLERRGGTDCCQNSPRDAQRKSLGN